MNDALRAKSTGLPPESGTSVPMPSLSTIPCQVCQQPAYLQKEWRAFRFGNQLYQRFTCINDHQCYRVLVLPRDELIRLCTALDSNSTVSLSPGEYLDTPPGAPASERTPRGEADTAGTSRA